MGSNIHSVRKIQQKIVSEHWAETIRRILSAGTGFCLLEPDFVRREVFGNAFSSQNLPLSSQISFLSNRSPNWMKLGHKGHLNKRNKFPKVVFSKSKDFPSDFG
jgi:hypothetical protein